MGGGAMDAAEMGGGAMDGGAVGAAEMDGGAETQQGPGVGSDAAVSAATLAGLEGMGMGLLARWCGDPGPRTALALVQSADAPVCAEVTSERWRVWKQQVAVGDVVARTARALASADARALLQCDVGYPDRLADDPRAPAVLIRRGRGAGPGHGEATVAIIGTRRASQVGKEVAAELGAELAGRGITVLSGMARGIDAAAHRGALGVAPTLTIGVIGCGPDQVYPPEHRVLWGQVSAGGGLLGEWPPGVAPNAWRFPARNRLLATLADVVVVVESARSGGSMHTVREAIDRSRPVLAVPGSVRSRVAEGTNLLISEGCDPCVDVTDVLCALSRQASSCEPVRPAARRRPHADARQNSLPGVAEITDRASTDGSTVEDTPTDPVEAAVLAAAGWQSVSLERIADALERSEVQATLLEVAGAVGRLCERGALVERAGWYEQTGRGQ
ncbi:MAG: DNA-processing protein DprA [Candidatus Microthrix parvicella]